jgi:hypothetical protein
MGLLPSPPLTSGGEVKPPKRRMQVQIDEAELMEALAEQEEDECPEDGAPGQLKIQVMSIRSDGKVVLSWY